MEKNISTWDHPALRKDGGNPLQNNGKSAEEIAREEQFWKRVSEANKRLGLTSSHPSAVTYLDLLEDAPADFQEEFLKDAPADFKERFYKIGGPSKQQDELAAREDQERLEESYSYFSDATGASREEAKFAVDLCGDDPYTLPMLVNITNATGASPEEIMDALKACQWCEEDALAMLKKDDDTSK